MSKTDANSGSQRLSFSEKARNIAAAALAEDSEESTNSKCIRITAGPKHPPMSPAAKEYPCILCNFKASTADDIQAHLLKQHSVVLADSHKIANLKKYLEYWKDRLRVLDIVEVSSQISAPTDGKAQLYYLISDILPEDKKIRQRLQTELLNEMLALQQKERHDKRARQCLFCRVAPRGRDPLFRHMRDAHGFSVGQPDNLVDVDGLVHTLRTKLEGLQCIYCERIFKDYGTLRAHMKKKRHFKINGQNKIYDRFYLVNYLEWGKNWEEIAREPTVEDDGSESTSSVDGTVDVWRDWVAGAPDAAIVSEPTLCLFSPAQFDNPVAAVAHMKEKFNADLAQWRIDWGLDMYETVRMINYLRKCFQEKRCSFCACQFDSVAELQTHQQVERHCKVARDADFWKNDDFLMPTLPDDPLLRCSMVVGGDGDDDWSDDEEELAAAREEAVERQKALLETLKKAGAL